MIVEMFDQQLDVIMLTDMSRLKELGFVLIQKGKQGENRLVHCGSNRLTPCQQRYSTIELECLAIQWAVNNWGLPRFDVLTVKKRPPAVGRPFPEGPTYR